MIAYHLFLKYGLFYFQSFCCIDKKGILSWPNPTAEKVFFLTTESVEESHNSSHQSAESGHSTEQLDDEYEDVFCVNRTEVLHQKQDKGTEIMSHPSPQ